MDINKITKTAWEALDDKKADNIVILNIGEVSVIADYFIIASGGNPSQINALVDSVEEKLAEINDKTRKYRRYTEFVMGSYGLWRYYPFIFFSKNDREFYNLERIWADCKEVDVNTL